MDSGDDVTMKSARKTESAIEAVCRPLVPNTLKSRAFDLSAARPARVRVLLAPGAMEAGLKLQVAGVLPEQASVMAPANPKLVEADI